MKTFTFTDGYEVTISDTFVVSWTFQKKGHGPVHATHFRKVPETGPGADFLRKNGKLLDDYLFADCGAKFLLRAGNGVREAVEAAASASKAAAAAVEAEHKARLETRRTESRSACGLSDPVAVSVKQFDGYPVAVVVDGRELRNVDWKSVSVGEFAWMEKIALEVAVAEFEAEKEETEAKAIAEREDRDKVFNVKKAEAARTGKPVELARWTTNRCMNGNGRECSFDNAHKYVLPDGSVRTTYTCCY